MFIGFFKHSIDGKGRLSIPKRFLDELPSPEQGRLLYGTKGMDGCLYLMLPDEWNAMVQQVQQASLGSEGVRRFSRQFFSMARELPVDGSGRILLPPEYRSLLGVDKEVVLLGVNRRIEMWSPERWDAEQEEVGGSYEQQAAEIFQ